MIRTLLAVSVDGIDVFSSCELLRFLSILLFSTPTYSKGSEAAYDDDT